MALWEIDTMSNDSIAKSKSMAFAKRIVRLYQFLTREKQEYVLSKQVLRSGTSIGANIAEAAVKTLSQSSVLQRRNAQKHTTGWNCSIVVTIFLTIFINRCVRIAVSCFPYLQLPSNPAPEKFDFVASKIG